MNQYTLEKYVVHRRRQRYRIYWSECPGCHVSTVNVWWDSTPPNLGRAYRHSECGYAVYVRPLRWEIVDELASIPQAAGL